MSDHLSLEDVTIAYGQTVAVEALDLAVADGELVTLLGPSGCGKTTTMRAIAGLVSIRSGRIELAGRDITRVPPSRRGVGLVFQSYALFPHLNVFENVAFGLRLAGTSDLRRRVEAGLATVGLSDFAGRPVAALSGGQQQRVALARSLVMEPALLLLDEPLSNLDARLRLDMRTELQRLQRETGVTMIFVTHDQGEALALSDRIVVMRDGRIEQIGTPEEIWSRPVSGFVADFVGFEVIVPEGDGALAWRPSAVALGAGPHRGRVVGTSFAGERREIVLESPLGRIKAETAATAPPHALGTELAFDLPRERAVRLARVG
ncbi:MAG: ABC transporter ATP-binding protein [Pseudomonadota bacterium]